MSQKNFAKNEGAARIAEATFAKKTGVALDLLIDTRVAELAQPVDYFERSGRIFYTEAGAGKMLLALELPADTLGPVDPVETPDADSGVPAQPGKCLPTELWVKRKAGLNTRLIFCTIAKDGSGELLRVRVRDNRTCVPGSLVFATAPAAGSSSWSAISRRALGKKSRF